MSRARERVLLAAQPLFLSPEAVPEAIADYLKEAGEKAAEFRTDRLFYLYSPLHVEVHREIEYLRAAERAADPRIARFQQAAHDWTDVLQGRTPRSLVQERAALATPAPTVAPAVVQAPAPTLAPTLAPDAPARAPRRPR